VSLNDGEAAGDPTPTCPNTSAQLCHPRDDHKRAEPAISGRQSARPQRPGITHHFLSGRPGHEECARCGLPPANRRHDLDRLPSALPVPIGASRAPLGGGDWWFDPAWTALMHLADGGVEFAADDLGDMGVPDPVSPAYRQSRRVHPAGGACRTWIGAPHQRHEAASHLRNGGQVDAALLVDSDPVPSGQRCPVLLRHPSRDRRAGAVASESHRRVLPGGGQGRRHPSGRLRSVHSPSAACGLDAWMRQWVGGEAA
jgi:hypothetical protein